MIISYILNQIVFGILFLSLTILALTLPGYLFLKQLKLQLTGLIERYTVSTTIGLVLFTVSAYILAAAHMRFLMYLFPLTGLVVFIRNRQSLFAFKTFSKKIGILFFLVLTVGVVGQVAVNAPSGIPYAEGLYFWSSHGHDGMWHLALMEDMKKDLFPFQNPEYAGHQLQNYHFFVDLLMSEFSRLFFFNKLDIYFRFMPIVFSLLLGLSSFLLVKNWTRDERMGIWAIFFTQFAGSFGYFVTWPRNHNIAGESIFWVSQTQSVLGNPPHAAAFIITTVFLFCLYKYLESYQKQYLILSILLAGPVIEFKVYAGTLILGSLLVVGLWRLIFERKIDLLLVFVLTLLISLGIYLPNSANSQEFLIWQPWWFIRTMVVAPDRLNWLDLELRRQTYLSEFNYKRVIQLETTAFLIFLFGILGMRSIGFIALLGQVRHQIYKNYFNLFLLIITLTSLLIPVFLLQKGVAWNAIQYNQYFLLFFGFYAAVSTVLVTGLIKQTALKLIFIALVILFAIPTQVGLLWQFYGHSALSKITYEELSALSFIKNTAPANSIILTAPFDQYSSGSYKVPPIPIYAWYDTGYVSAFSNHPTLISDQEQVGIMGYKANDLLEERRKIFETTNLQDINNFMKNNNVKYVYLVWGQKFATDSATLDLDLVFSNKDAKVYKVRND